MLKQFIRTKICWLSCAVLLAACGGGGGSSGTSNTGGTSGGNSGGSTTSAALAFTPATATATLDAGVSGMVTVGATVNRPSDFNSNVYAFVVDGTGVLLPNASFNAQSPTQYSALLQTSASLAPGVYKGNFTVNLCRDQACSQHYPGSPMQLPYEFTVRAAAQKLAATPVGSLSPTVNLGAAAPAPVQVNVTGIQQKWTATSNAAWILLRNASGTGSGSFTVEFDTSKSAEGVQSGTIEVTSGDGQRIVLNTVLTTIARNFSVSNTGFAFTAVNGAPIPAQELSFDMEGGGSWTADTSVAWLTATPTSGTLPGKIGLTVNPSRASLASGQYGGKLTLHSPSGKDRSLDAQLNLTKAELSLSTDTITLGGPYGRDFANVSLAMYLNTMTNSHPWSLVSLPAWVNPSARSGQVNQNGTTVQIGANLSSAPIGSSTTLATATAQVNGDTIVKPVTMVLNRDQQKILPSETGVAMVSVPGWSRLVRTVTVRDNFGASTDWTATSDQSWLQATRNGNQLTLTANPSTLPADTTSYATVTLATSSAGVAVPEQVRVALWKGSATPVGKIDFKFTDYSYVAADTVRPLVYVSNSSSFLDVYNVYTGQKVATSPALGGSLGAIAVSPNGDRLYVYDLENKTIVVVNAKTLAKLDTWALNNWLSSFTEIQVARPNGEEIVLTGMYEAFRANGQRLSIPLAPPYAVSRDSKRLYAPSFFSPFVSKGAYDMDFSAIAGGTLHMKSAGGDYGQATDMAASFDGQRFYSAWGTPTRCTVSDATTLAGTGDLAGAAGIPNNVEVDSFGRVYCGARGDGLAADVWVHDSNGVLLKQFRLGGNTSSTDSLLARRMVVSSDGMMLVGVAGNSLAIIAVGP